MLQELPPWGTTAQLLLVDLMTVIDTWFPLLLAYSACVVASVVLVASAICVS